jgi:hypothetical protein
MSWHADCLDKEESNSMPRAIKVMTSKVFIYRGYFIKVMAHECAYGEQPSKNLTQLGIGWYSTSIIIRRYGDGKKIIEEPQHSSMLSVTPERAIEYGKNIAIRVIDEEIMYLKLTRYGRCHAVSGIQG